MIDHEFGSEDLRERFLSPPEGASAAENCPPKEQFLRAALGELSVRENRSLADHGAVCPVCAVTWKLAREYARESALQSRAPDSVVRDPWPTVFGRRWIPVAAAAAAVLALVAVLLPWREDRGPTVPVLRTLGEERTESLIAENARLPLQQFTLRWSVGPEGSRYDVRVTDRRLNHLAGAVALERPEYTVPTDALAELEPGSLVLWQVESSLPDGRRIVSQTFATHLE